MFNTLRLILSPFFLKRYYLVKDIDSILQKYRFQGTVIDIGSGSKPYAGMFKKHGITTYFGVDFKKHSINKDFAQGKPDYYFSQTYKVSHILPFKNNQFGNAVSFQVLEHHQEPKKLIQEMVRVTKRGGYIMVSFPFVWALHEEPQDYFRFTHYSVSGWFHTYGCKVIKIKKEGSLFSAISMLMNEELNQLAAKNRFWYSIALVIYIPLYLFQLVSLILDKIYKSSTTFSNYLIVVKKI